MKTYTVHKATHFRPLGDSRPCEVESATILLDTVFPVSTEAERDATEHADADTLDRAFIRHLPHRVAVRLARRILKREPAQESTATAAAELASLVLEMAGVSERGAPDYLRIVSYRVFSPKKWARMIELAKHLRKPTQ